jgi:hypothetical protein
VGHALDIVDKSNYIADSGIDALSMSDP